MLSGGGKRRKGRDKMSRRQLELKLIPVSKKLSKKGGYRGHIVDRREMGYDEVIGEAISSIRRRIRRSP